MKKKELQRLLDIFDQGNREPQDFSEFRNPDEARESFKKLILIRRELSDSNSDFSPFFSAKVMGKISQFSKRPGLEEYLSMQLSRVMTYGLTAVVLVFLTLFFLQGQEGMGLVPGSDSSNDLNFISSLFYEF